MVPLRQRSLAPTPLPPPPPPGAYCHFYYYYFLLCPFVDIFLFASHRPAHCSVSHILHLFSSPTNNNNALVIYTVPTAAITIYRLPGQR